MRCGLGSDKEALLFGGSLQTLEKPMESLLAEVMKVCIIQMVSEGRLSSFVANDHNSSPVRKRICGFDGGGGVKSNCPGGCVVIN